jgi:hypothetical protein
VEHDSEFEYNNYDVVEKLIVNDSTPLWCWWIIKKLNSNYRNYAERFNMTLNPKKQTELNTTSGLFQREFVETV